MFEINTIYHGFKLTKSEEVKEIHSSALIFVHEITKAEVIVLTNDDDNKVFTVAFRTPPFDDTGVAHILEHSVLNGSKKYPVKEPFAELLKSSLYTFLNAMTYPDRTVYPVASRNAQDFSNLMDVYLDAVFCPLLSEETFLQEGWHYDIDEKTGDLSYSGVVYNEMLGSYSDPENILIEEMNKVLYPDSIYAKSSGGNPKFIPELDFTKFIDFHKRYYHPSNCRVLLYGDLDVLSELSHLESYFKAYKYQPISSTIKPQPRRSILSRRITAYPLSPGANSSSKTYALRSYLLGHPIDAEYMLSFSILSRILSGTAASPLKKALIDSHLGESTLDYGFENDMFDNYYCIGLKGTDRDKVDEIEGVIDKTLHDLVRNGIDGRMIQGSMNSIEFQLREANFGSYPKGLCYGLIMMNSWIYDAEPLMHLRYESILQGIKEKVSKGQYFEKMINKYLLQNQHRSTIVLRPDEHLEKKDSDDLKNKLHSIKAKMSKSQLAEIQEKNQRLHEYQLTPDSVEALATIPKLSLDCVEKSAEEIPLDIISDDSPEILFSKQPTNGIAYISIVFDAAGLPQDLLPYISLFNQIILQVGTKNRDFVDLIQEIDINTGGITSTYSAFPIKENPNKINSFFSFTGKSLKDKLPTLLTILSEIITQVNLEDHKRIGELLHIAKSNLRSRIIPNGHTFASTRLASYHSRIGWYREIAGGISQYHFLESVIAEYEKSPEKTLKAIKTISNTLFHRNTMKIHLTGSGEELKVLKNEIHHILDFLSDTTTPIVDYQFNTINPNEAFMIPSNIHYVGKGANLFDFGYRYNGNYEVLETILSRDYLWNTVRVQGGAYGCFTNFDILSGNFCCMSYRDPNLDETLQVFDGVSDFIHQLRLTKSDLDRFIIGTIGGIDTPKTPDQKGATAFSRYLSGITQEDVQHRRDQILSCDLEQLKEYCALFKDVSQKGSICVVGGEEKIRQNKNKFQHIENVLDA